MLGCLEVVLLPIHYFLGAFVVVIEVVVQVAEMCVLTFKVEYIGIIYLIVKRIVKVRLSFYLLFWNLC